MNQTKLTDFFIIKRSKNTQSKVSDNNRIIYNPIKNIQHNNPEKIYILRFDGASKGNPGKAGAGAVIYENDKEIWTISRYLGKQTNNYAECSAMVLGIQEAYNREIRNLRVEGDSMLIINQLKGKWQIKNNDLKELHSLIKMKLKSFNNITYNHIYRKYNTRADELANLSISKKI